MNINVGDKVQIKPGSIDVTNGNVAKEGQLYTVGGPLKATIDLILDDWDTNSRWGLPKKITRVRCLSKNGDIVWQVQPRDIGGNIIRVGVPLQTTVDRSNNVILEQTESGKADLMNDTTNTNSNVAGSLSATSTRYTTSPNSESWVKGIATANVSTGNMVQAVPLKTKLISGSHMGIIPSVNR